MREEALCVSVSLFGAEEALWSKAPCLAASLLEKRCLLQEGQRTHDLNENKSTMTIHHVIIVTTTIAQYSNKATD